jgi:hypothetical protein
MKQMYVETLHAELRLCNTWVQRTAVTCKYLFKEDGTARTPAERDSWFQKTEPKRKGWDLYKHLVEVMGKGVGDPCMTGFVGEQQASLMKDGGKKWWEHGKFYEKCERLKEVDPEAGEVIVQLRKVFQSVHTIIDVVNKPMPDTQLLTKLCSEFTEAAYALDTMKMLDPIRWQWAYMTIPQHAKLSNKRSCYS